MVWGRNQKKGRHLFVWKAAVDSTKCWFGGSYWALVPQCPVGKKQSPRTILNNIHNHGSLLSPCFKWRNSKYIKEFLITSILFPLEQTFQQFDVLVFDGGSIQGLQSVTVGIMITDEPNYPFFWCNMLGKKRLQDNSNPRYLKHSTFSRLELPKNNLVGEEGFILLDTAMYLHSRII